MNLNENFYCFERFKIGVVLNHENMEGVKALHHNSRYDVIIGICHFFESHVKIITVVLQQTLISSNNLK